MSNARNTTRRNTFRRILAAGEPPCGICGEPIDYQAHHSDPRSFTVDHITPLSVTGPEGDVIDNVQPAHRACNRDKSAKLVGWRPGCTYETARSW